MINIVMVEPEIPPNTGNVARSCAATGAKLHLVGKLGFSVDDKQLKRAGLDYWHLLDIEQHVSLEELWAKDPTARYFYLSTKGYKHYSNIKFASGDYIVFGKETKGLPAELIAEKLDFTFRIPMREGARSLNLANSVAIVLFEALRQLDFPGLQ
ncbi:MAG: tRNA (uridine(34)/cytosine(34)/5-carboxymethylaminomethyluridine(34)-2'-O)-methyltransferase TrmL [Peptococcaceae bacterium]|nr:tRNA (uridine(34)/cytosine(34)/5-carboxymethylaminomethyluridine(34)-2'-O)-methyltransferase TrmL [Peptococcaceae bacterium]